MSQQYSSRASISEYLGLSDHSGLEVLMSGIVEFIWLETKCCRLNRVLTVKSGIRGELDILNSELEEDIENFITCCPCE